MTPVLAAGIAVSGFMLPANAADGDATTPPAAAATTDAATPPAAPSVTTQDVPDPASTTDASDAPSDPDASAGSTGASGDTGSTTPPATPGDSASDGTGADAGTTGGIGTGANLFSTMSTEGDFSTQAVAGSSNIIINASAIRKESTPNQDTNNASYLAGLSYALYPVLGSGSSSSPYRPDMNNPTGYACTIGASPATSCTITVPNTASGGNNRNKSFFVVQTANSSTYDTPIYMTGDYSGPTTQYYYAGRTGATLTSPNDYQFPATAQDQSGSSTRSGVLAASLNNPPVQLNCQAPLTIAIQMDLSASVSPDQRATYATALKNLVDSLAGTGTKIALFTFGNSSPVNNWEQPAPLDVDTQTAQLKTNITTFTGNPGTQRTNWDMGLRRIADAAYHYDLALFLTDGAPNWISNSNSSGGTGPNGDNVAVKSVEQAIFSANAIKSEKTRVVAVGIGNGATGNVYRNLAAISGPIANSDYFQGDWNQLESNIKNIVNQSICRVPVKVTKQVPSGANWTTANNWAMTLGTSAVTAGTASIGGTNPQNTGSGTNAAGEANWVVSFTQKAATATFTLSETMQSGWAFNSGTYTVYHQDGTSTTGNLTGISNALSGISVTDRVEAIFRNSPSSSTVAVNKIWTVKDSAGTVIGTYNVPAQQGDTGVLPGGLNATPSVGGTATTWGAVNSGYTAGQTVAISETASIDTTKLPGCVINSKLLTSANGQPVSPGASLAYQAKLAVGANTYTITNTVTCTQTLSLVKDVAFGSAPTNSWTLSATKPGGSSALDGPTGKYSTGSPVSGAVSVDTAYTLDESGGPATYIPTTDGWLCKAGSGTSVPLTGSAVKVALGQTVTCTITNTTATVTLLKHINDDASLKPNFWNLTGTPAAGVSGLTPSTVTGADGGGDDPNVASTFEVRPDHTYTISEALNGNAPATLPYLQISLQKWDGTQWIDVSNDQISVGPGQHAVYRFVNAPVPAFILPLTGGVGSDAYAITGLIALLLAAGLAFWQRRRLVRAGR